MEFRAHPLDGALLYFDRKTGTQVRLDGPGYAQVTRRAPRVVQLGLTNRCNLRCSFCFRDRTLPSRWTAAEIVEWAKALDEAGVLELGFGQGEPLLFPNFCGLVRELARETNLAINFTTNGLRLDDARLDEFEGAYGQLRLSYYADNDPLARVALLARRGARFGVNLLVTSASLAGLNATIADLVDAGCRDLLLLAYNGPDPSLHLSPAQDRALARCVLAAHGRYGEGLTIGLSVCFGRRLHEVPQLFVGDDCGAGDDFITLDSEKRMLACSFHARTNPVDSADAAVVLWRANRMNRAHAGLDGCARVRLPLARAQAQASATPRVSVWRAFASNHSASYTLVGEFSTVEKSARYIAWLETLIQRCRIGPEHDRPAPQNLWQALGREGQPPAAAWLDPPRALADWTPETILGGGRRVLVHADHTLRTFDIFAHQLVRQHGRILWSSEQWGREQAMAFGVEAGDAIESLARRLAPLCSQSHARGPRLYGLVPPDEIERAAQILRTEAVRAIAGAHESDETLAAALVDPPELASRKRRVEWTLLERLSLEQWTQGLAELRADPVAKLAAIDWHHPFRLPERLDAFALLGHTLVHSEGAPFHAALQAWFDGHRVQLVASPKLRIRVARRVGSETSERPFNGLTASHVKALSRPGAAFVVQPFHSSFDILPRNPAAAFAQLNAILGDVPHVAVDIMAERPLADALAQINADLDAATCS